MPTLPKGVYCIVDDAPGRDVLALVKACAEGGAAVVQLRLKRAGARQLLETARAARKLCPFLLINDRPDIAKLARADGVHLGQDDLPVAEARKLLGPAAVIGLSTHSDPEIDAATGADYIGFGPIFTTRSKPGAVLPDPHGLDGLARAVARSPVPVVAIGGLTVATAGQIARTGAHCAAVIAEVCDAPDPLKRVQELVEAFR